MGEADGAGEVRDFRGGHWWRAHNAIFKYTEAHRISLTDLGVYCLLCSYAGYPKIRPSLQRGLATKLGKSKRTICRSLIILEGWKLLRRTRRTGANGRFLATRYDLLPVPPL